MIPTQGVNHIALSVSDMKRTLEFYTDVLGLRLLGLFPMHGVPGASHAFLDMGGGRMLSFIQFAAPPEKREGVTHPADPGSPSAVATMPHLALQVPDAAAEAALRGRGEQARLRGSPPHHHGLCLPIYFKGPRAQARRRGLRVPGRADAESQQRRRRAPRAPPPRRGGERGVAPRAGLPPRRPARELGRRLALRLLPGGVWEAAGRAALARPLRRPRAPRRGRD